MFRRVHIAAKGIFPLGQQSCMCVYMTDYLNLLINDTASETHLWHLVFGITHSKAESSVSRLKAPRRGMYYCPSATRRPKAPPEGQYYSPSSTSRPKASPQGLYYCPSATSRPKVVVNEATARVTVSK